MLIFEIAPTSRTYCLACKRKIVEGELRLRKSYFKTQRWGIPYERNQYWCVEHAIDVATSEIAALIRQANLLMDGREDAIATLPSSKTFGSFF